MTDTLAADAVEEQDAGVVDKIIPDAGEPAAAAKDAPPAAKPVPEVVAPADGDKPAPDAAKPDGDKPDAEAEVKDDKGGDALPENWRDLAADGDDDTLKLLKRYGSLKGVAKALKEAQTTIRTGKLRQPMPDPKNEAAMAEWRKSEGIPDDPTGYKLPETVTKRMTDEDKPLISSFTEYAHAKGARPDVVEIASEWYFDSLDQIEGQQVEADKASREEAEEALRSSWGNAEYKGNKKLAERFVESIPGIGIDLAELRLPNGKLLGSVPEFMEWASDQGRTVFGDVTFATSDSEARHTNRRAEIEKIRDTDFDKYERDGLDKELRGLIETDLKRGKR